MSKLAESKAKQQEVLATFKDDQAELRQAYRREYKTSAKAEDNRANA